MKKLILFLGISLLYFYCAPQPVQPAKPPEEEMVIIGEETPPETEAAPAPAEEEVIVTEEEEKPSPPPPEETVEEGEVAVAPAPEEKLPPPPAPAKVYGYRVQIVALDASKPGNKEKAEQFAKEAEARLRNEYKVYIEYIPPYYKVRVGDFISKEEAERMKIRLRNMGYYDAWIVETEITPKR